MTNKTTHSNLTLFQWNCHVIINKRDTLTQICGQFDILALSETWLSSDKTFFLNDFHILRKDGPSNKSGGVLLAIKRSVPFTKLDSIFSLDGVLETIAVKITSSYNDIFIISIYRHPSNAPPSIWEELFNSVPTSGEIIITGDFNAHHTSWGCNRSDSMGNSLFDSSQDFSLSFINDGTPTYISYFIHSSSVIDLTFVSSGLVPFCSWRSFDDSLGSDYIPSIITVNHPIQSRSFFSHKLHTSKINRKFLFSTFSLVFPSLSNHLDSVISPIEKYDIFCNFLKDTITSLLPEKNKSFTNSSPAQGCKENKSNNRVQSSQLIRPPAPWWNEQCSEAVELRKQTLRAFRRNPSRSNYLNLKKREALTRNVLRHAKRMGWKSFCESITSTTSISALWQVVKRFKNRFLNPTTFLSPSSSGMSTEIQDLIDSISPPSCLHKLSIPLFYTALILVTSSTIPFNLKNYIMSFLHLKTRNLLLA